MHWLRFDQPELLWLLLLAGPIVWLGMRGLSQLDPWRRWTAIGLRLTILVLLVAMLAGLQTVRRHTDLTVIAVMDRSESVRHFFKPPDSGQYASFADVPRLTGEQWMREYLRRAAADKRGDDRFGIVGFDARPSVRVMPDTTLTLDSGTRPEPRQGTDIAAALRTAMALFPADTSARMVLISDGNDTRGGDSASQSGRAGGDDSGVGGVIEAAREARAAGIAVDVLPLEYRVENEVMVEALHAPAEARRGQTVAIRVVLRATRPARGTLHLLHDDVPQSFDADAQSSGTAIGYGDWTREDIGAWDGEESAPDEPNEHEGMGDAADALSGIDETGQYVAVKQIELPLRQGGPNRFEAIFEPAPNYDSIVANNRAETFTQVVGEGQILFVDNVGGDSGMILPEALAGRGVELEIIEPMAMPTRLAELQRYDAIVLQNVPASMVTAPQRRMLARYVHDLGGGLIKVGGPESFGAGGWAHTEVDHIMPVDSEIPEQTVMPAGALVLVIDRSGSMNASVAGTGMNRQQIANEAAVLALKSLYPQDMVGVVSFDRSARWEVPLQTVDDPARIAERIRSIRPGGGTHIYPGIVEAERALARLGPQDVAVKHVIVLTDGKDNPGLSNDYPGVAQKLVSQDATLSTVGVGANHEIDGQLLDRLAQWGNGTFYHADNPRELPEIFVKESQTLRRTLIREQRFEPQRLSTGSPVTAQIANLPSLHGFVLTHPKRDPRIYMPIVGPDNEPIFAHWQVGLGRTAAFTSDATNRWASDWLDWPSYADFWTRLVRTMARPAQGRNLDLVASRQGDRLRIRLDASADDLDAPEAAGFADFLDVRGSVITPAGQTRAIELEQVGPGIYETVTDAAEPGNYIASLLVQGPDGTRQAVFGGATRPPGDELRRFSSDTATLKRIAEITGGRWLDPLDPERMSLFDRTGIPESRSVRPLWRTLLVWLMVLFLLDVACRRIAWDPLALAHALRIRARALAISISPRRVRSEPTLTALKNRRTVVEADLTHARAAPAHTSNSVADPVPADTETRSGPGSVGAQRRFTVQPNAKAADDIPTSLGGAKNQPDFDATNKPAPNADGNIETSSTATTSRLRAAKQRARQNLKNDDS